MAHEINLGGTIYISSRRAAEESGYSQDYIGQLIRTGRILGKKIGGLWYVLEESLLGHKSTADAYVPTPSKRNRQAHEPLAIDSLLSFDGNRYVSGAEAARMTGYSQDYISYLARAAAVPAKQIGNRWYIEAKGLKAHKAEKDRLLAVVQAESVGLKRNRSDAGTKVHLYVQHYQYTSHTGELLPTITKTTDSPTIFEEERGDELHQIPIRVVHARSVPEPRAKHIANLPQVAKQTRSGWYAGATVAIVTIVTVVAYNINLIGGRSMYTESSVVRNTALAGIVDRGIDTVSNNLAAFFIHEVSYTRVQ